MNNHNPCENCITFPICRNMLDEGSNSRNIDNLEKKCYMLKEYLDVYLKPEIFRNNLNSFLKYYRGN